jgi:hypothetical protein
MSVMAIFRQLKLQLTSLGYSQSVEKGTWSAAFSEGRLATL